MNKQLMADAIKELVPALDLDEAKWRDAERRRKQFVLDYTRAKITVLSSDEYVIGKGPANASFCYRLERDMDDLGRILGATAFKFGIYFGSTKSDPVQTYRFSPHWGSSRSAAFIAVKQAIVDLLTAAASSNHVAVAENPISPMFKGKLLFLYFPDKYAPIYSEAHLLHFLAATDLTGDYKRGPDMQRALMTYREEFSELRTRSPLLFMRLLYQVFDAPMARTSGNKQTRVPLLDEAINGADFITKLPPQSAQVQGNGAQLGKQDFEKDQKNRKRIGNRGEEIVIALERKRLKDAKKPALANRVHHVSADDDSAGFDVLSFDADGAERPIEVKATTAGDLSRGFYITENELAKSELIANYHVYVVLSTMTKKPRIFVLEKPNLKSKKFSLRPLAFHVLLAHG